MEREMVSDRVKDILSDKKKSSLVYGGIPYGYENKNGKLVPNTKEQKTINKIYSLKKKGYSLQKISDYLNRNKHPKRNGTKWSRFNIHHLIKTDRSNISIHN